MSRLYEAMEKARLEGSSTSEASPRPMSMAPTGGPHFVEGPTVTPHLDGCLVELMREDEPWIEQMRTLTTRLRAMEGSEDVRRIGMMSAIGGEGKTTLAAMLSFILAEERGERVLLIDADLRHREVESALGVKPVSGLGDWLKQPTPQVSVRRIGAEGPFLLGAGRPFPKPWELVASPHLGTLLDTAAREFRYVITDCPAEGPVADASRLQEIWTRFCSWSVRAPRHARLSSPRSSTFRKRRSWAFCSTVRSRPEAAPSDIATRTTRTPPRSEAAKEATIEGGEADSASPKFISFVPNRRHDHADDFIQA